MAVTWRLHRIPMAVVATPYECRLHGGYIGPSYGIRHPLCVAATWRLHGAVRPDPSGGSRHPLCAATAWRLHGGYIAPPAAVPLEQARLHGGYMAVTSDPPIAVPLEQARLWRECSVVVGMHPDQATEVTVLGSNLQHTPVLGRPTPC